MPETKSSAPNNEAGPAAVTRIHQDEPAMHGVMIVNGHLDQPPNLEAFQLYATAAARLQASLVCAKNTDYIVEASCSESSLLWNGTPFAADFVLFLDKDIRLLRHIEYLGIPVYNSSQAIALCDDKWAGYALAAQAGIRIPRTILAPMRFFPSPPPESWIAQCRDTLGLPLIIKECYGSHGDQVFLCHTEADILHAVSLCGNRPYMAQECITTSFGSDIRMQMIGRQCIACVRRTATAGFKANASSGGAMTPEAPTSAMRDMAARCMDIFGLHFAGLDLLLDARGDPVFCEINSNAHIINISHATGVDVAFLTMRHILSLCQGTA